MNSAARNRGAPLSWTVVTAVGVVVILALWGSLDFYSSIRLYNSSAGDPYRVAAQQERFREAATLLPGSAVVGYLSDIPFEQAGGSASFFAAQYVLAPRILVEVSGDRKPEWVLGNFSRRASYEELQKTHQLSLVKDFGNGVAIFRRQVR